MNFFVTLFFILSCHLAFAESICNNIDTYAGKLDVYSSGQVILDGQKLAPTIDKKSGTEMTYTSIRLTNIVPGQFFASQYSNPAATFGYGTNVHEISFKRNAKKQIVEIDAMSGQKINPNTGSLIRDFNSPPSRQKFIFEYDKDGSCILRRVIENSAVSFDRGLCEKLSGLFETFSESDIDRCNQIVRKMSSTVEDFKKSIKAEGLTVSENAAKNPYQRAILQSAECTKILAGAVTKEKTISIPNPNKAKAKQ